MRAQWMHRGSELYLQSLDQTQIRTPSNIEKQWQLSKELMARMSFHIPAVPGRLKAFSDFASSRVQTHRHTTILGDMAPKKAAFLTWRRILELGWGQTVVARL
jgi:hypothetical protein